MASDPIDWFANHLDEQLDDFELEDQGISPVLYLDTADVTAAVMGLHWFYQEGTFDSGRFEKDRSLVAALADSGWLGAFHLLQAHQDEFLGLLKAGFHAPNASQDLRSRVPVFLRDTNIGDVTAAHEEAKLRGDVEEVVRAQAGSARSFFKALQCIRGTWETRIHRWAREGLLHLSTNRISYTEVLRSDLFQAARKEFTEARPNKGPANFADAMAVCQLAQAVSDYASGRAKALPRYYVSDHFARVVTKPPIEASLAYDRPRGGRGTVLRDADYFIFRATFRPSVLALKDVGTKRGNDERAEIVALRSAISEARKQPRASAELLDEIKFGGRTLRELVNDLRSFYFLENVWLPAAAVDDALTARAGFVEAAIQLQKDPEFARHVAGAVDRTKHELSANVERYRLVRTVAMAIDKTPSWCPTGPEPGGADNDYFQHYTLIRFGFPEDAEDGIVGLLRDLCSGDLELERSSRLRMARSWFDLDDPSRLVDLCAASSALWMAGQQPLLATLLEADDARPHWSLDVVYVAAVLDSPRSKHVERARLRMAQLVQGHAQQPNLDLAVGLAYLSFHDWLVSGYAPVYQEHQRRAMTDGQRSRARQLIGDAMAYAMAARDHPDERKRVYATNQYLYYWCEGLGGPPDEVVREAFEELTTYKTRRHHWHYRYDDTLARYLYRSSFSSADEWEWQRLIDRARSHSTEACDASVNDPAIQGFLTLLSAARPRHPGP